MSNAEYPWKIECSTKQEQASYVQWMINMATLAIMLMGVTPGKSWPPHFLALKVGVVMYLIIIIS